MRRAAALIALLPLSACGQSSNYASAGLTAGVAVAAAGAYRAATGGCWAACPPGTACDEASGTCAPLPCRNACPADGRCVIVEGKETCVRGGERDVGAAAPAPAEPGEDAPAAAAAQGTSSPDPCRGLCFRGERCEVDGGVATCAPEENAPAPQRDPP